MFPTIVAVRNDRVVASVSTPRLAATLSCAQTLAVGLDAEVLVVAAEAVLDAGEGSSTALTYTLMTRDRRGHYALQEVTDRDGEVGLSVPVNGGTPQDPRVLEVLADAMGQAPMPVDKVARKDHGGTFGEQPFMPAEQGRVVVDAGTMSTLHQRVREIGGQALYVARSPEAGRLALQAGLPRTCLLSGDGSRTEPDDA